MESWNAYLNNENGIVNAPTGSGKTLSLFVPILLESIQQKTEKEKGIHAIWITPIKALSKEISAASQRAIEGMGSKWKVGVRNGDTTTTERSKQKKSPPQILITTPESLHLLLATPGYEDYFKSLKCMVVDEWHELVGSKRGVQIELALSRMKSFLPDLKVWGISATIGNMEEALQVLMGSYYKDKKTRIVKSQIKKRIEIISVLPDEMDQFPWAGHYGMTLLEKVLPIIHESQSTLIFANTRAMCEIWYQRLLELDPDLAGWMAMHHGSLDRKLREWVEDSLHAGSLKAVVCTSSLDLGVDFRPVETIVQIGSPKGVARFMQRAGRSGHQPGALSKIYFVPTHSLELVEAAALRNAIAENKLERRIPYVRSFDVLVQYLLTLAVSNGFMSEETFEEVRKTYCFSSISQEEWAWILSFLIDAGSLSAYDEYRKIGIDKTGRYRVLNKYIAQRHRMSIGTIVGSDQMQVKYVSGKRIGTVEEWFVAQLNPGDVFWFAGKSLVLVRIKDMMVQVRKSKSKKGRIPVWAGGRMQLSSQMSEGLRTKIDQAARLQLQDEELLAMSPLFETQLERSRIPRKDELLIELFKDKEGHHLLVYPFEGRFVHEGMASLMAFRISKDKPSSFSIAMNDYGFELLSDEPFDLSEDKIMELLSSKKLSQDIESSLNSVEMAKRTFRDIASISGLIFKGFPGNQKKSRHLQSSTALLFGVFHDYEPNNLLYLQAYDEVRTFHLEETRMRMALERIKTQNLVFTRPYSATPFSFPIIADRLRAKMSTEKLTDRIKKMKLKLERE